MRQLTRIEIVQEIEILLASQSSDKDRLEELQRRLQDPLLNPKVQRILDKGPDMTTEEIQFLYRKDIPKKKIMDVAKIQPGVLNQILSLNDAPENKCELKPWQLAKKILESDSSLSIKEVAAKTGANYGTLRTYIRRGKIIRPKQRKGISEKKLVRHG